MQRVQPGPLGLVITLCCGEGFFCTFSNAVTQMQMFLLAALRVFYLYMCGFALGDIYVYMEYMYI